MHRYSFLLVSLLSLIAFTMSRSDEPAASSSDRAASPAPSIEQARRQAEQLHTAMHATLQIVHHRYYKEDEGLLLPAAVLKDVFAEIEKEHHIQLRWLAVEGQVMNTDHEAKSDFEKAAAQALHDRKESFEETADGHFRRAAPITLSNHCLKCHVPDRKNTEDRIAGLIISMKVAAP